MSAIAGVLDFSGGTQTLQLARAMTQAMSHRGPDGVSHWRGEGVALGHCMLRTTPEAAHERQPCIDETENFALVMDGHVDNREELHRELRAHGLQLRGESDCELVLRAYQVWRDRCPEKIIGEFVFFVWDATTRELFGARDAVGTRICFYSLHSGKFAFASEMKGVLGAGIVPRHLNEDKVLDYLVVQHDRDDATSTFYKAVSKLEAGCAIRVGTSGMRTWRYWDPRDLPALRFGSPEECADAFREQLAAAVRSRLRSNGPVGALLSGGLDSSSVVEMVRSRLRDEIGGPLQTFSLVRATDNSCADWVAIQEMLKRGGLQPTVIASSAASGIADTFVDWVTRQDDPFVAACTFGTSFALGAARNAGVRVVLEGMGGDALFYSPDLSERIVFDRRMLTCVPGLLRAQRRFGFAKSPGASLWRFLAQSTPDPIRAAYRRARGHRADSVHFGPELSGDNFRRLRAPIRAQYFAKKQQERSIQLPPLAEPTDQALHARVYTSPFVTFGHEVEGSLAQSMGLEERSPFSDRRLVEFAIQMPVTAKLFLDWYKPTLRAAMAGMLPSAVVWRQNMLTNPSWSFYWQLTRELCDTGADFWNLSEIQTALEPWIDPDALASSWREFESSPAPALGANLLSLAIFARWLHSRQLE